MEPSNLHDRVLQDWKKGDNTISAGVPFKPQMTEEELRQVPMDKLPTFHTAAVEVAALERATKSNGSRAWTAKAPRRICLCSCPCHGVQGTERPRVIMAYKQIFV